ncbi:protein disulfide-isomerase [Cimex lectularius]|uniref:Protein disulfide-isomerase n=1 Tax=Cimex lectularius TaxID=79782 RepID=A0A8I6TE74_CIMLE|nr:protein disulfide-isomerase [Cimex lectularius]
MSRILLALSLILAVVFSTDIKTEDGVLVLTASNFDNALETYEHVLVEFYAPWCGHCKALAPHYAKAAEKLAEMESAVKLAKVDATVETSLSEKYNIRGYPTLKYFHGGKVLDYPGVRQTEDIVNWLLKKSGPSAKELNSVEEVKAFVEDKQVAMVGFFKDANSDLAKNFMEVAFAVDDVQFGVSYNEGTLAEYKADENKVVMFKKFDEGEVVYTGTEDPNELKKFILTNSLPLVVEFNHDTAQKIFGGDVKSHLLFFLSKEKGDFEKLLEPVKPLAKDYRDKLLFVVLNVDEPDHVRILDYFGLAKDDVPSMRLIKLEDDMLKYKPDTSDLSPEHVKSFVDAYLSGTLKEHLLSQTLPEDWDKHPVKVLVSSNFDEVVFNTEKDVLVEFYAPWCTHCNKLAPIYDELGEKFKDNNEVLVAKIDATANELEHTKIESFPTLKLYKKGDNKVVEYTGDRTLEGLSNFLESGGESVAPPQEEVGDETVDDLPTKDEL